LTVTDAVFAVPAYGPQNDVTLKMPAFEWVHVQLHQQKGMISLSPPTICNSALIPPRKGAGYWPGEYADRNRAVANQQMTGSNARWKWTTDYNRRSIAETAMYRVKQLFGGSLTLRDYDGQVAEAMALVRALNKMTKAGMPESVRIA
ncbi:transposase, partial [Klebsiella pneumoniae]|uniref:transposase n=1 Tax=Klebsiella pneumoniae TaxID=573 RepID=UPI0038556DE9